MSKNFIINILKFYNKYPYLAIQNIIWLILEILLNLIFVLKRKIFYDVKKPNHPRAPSCCDYLKINSIFVKLLTHVTQAKRIEEKSIEEKL
ncbi:unnamed protein product [Meloidogyne enterolobii]|uniref:Uncharacterized protein n=1 Tax=Meloidogyne enterolobii TaxID=390850 RepID=A0ACB0XR75_MELEN